MTDDGNGEPAGIGEWDGSDPRAICGKSPESSPPGKLAAEGRSVPVEASGVAGETPAPGPPAESPAEAGPVPPEGGESRNEMMSTNDCPHAAIGSDAIGPGPCDIEGPGDSFQPVVPQPASQDRAGPVEME